MQLVNMIVVNGTLRVLNGLHIGAGNEKIEIGGLDNAVIKDPRTGLPYIPGSSLKGKMRFLTEWHHNKVKDENTHECPDPNCAICRIFGALMKSNGFRGPTRLILRDAHITGDYKYEDLFEVKYSTAIDRITGTAKNKSLRNIERVVPGTLFGYSLTYRVFDNGDNGTMDYKNMKIVANAMQMLEADTLGGSGSRGCGKIGFENLSLTWKKGEETRTETDIENTEKLKELIVKEF